MTDAKKKRMSMLDDLAAASKRTPAPAAAASMMSNNRALRSARDAVDSHHVWDLDPWEIVDDRIANRLDPRDVEDLRDPIDQNGQTVPILVRRHPTESGKYLLAYGRRRLEAIRSSSKVEKVRALVATLDDSSAMRAQISENMARRDLSFIEKSLFANELVENGFGNQRQVAEVLTVTKSAVSMAIAVVELVGADIVRAIGPAPGVGRPRWEALGRAMEGRHIDHSRLIRVADDVPLDPGDVSVAAFEAVLDAVGTPPKPPAAKRASPARHSTPLTLNGQRAGAIRTTGKSVTLDLKRGPFADWVAAQGQDLINDLHTRWLQRGED